MCWRAVSAFPSNQVNQLLPLPKILFRSDLEESSLFPPTLLPSTSCLQLCLLKVVLLAPSSVTPCHGERTALPQDEKPCSRASYCRAKTESKPGPEFAQPSHHGPPAHDLNWSFGCFHLHCPSKHRKHIREGKEYSWLLAMVCATDLGLLQAEQGGLQGRDTMFPSP